MVMLKPKMTFLLHRSSKIGCQNNYAKIAFLWFLPFCGIASQVEHAREYNRIYAGNQVWKRDTDCQNYSLTMRVYRLV